MVALGSARLFVLILVIDDMEHRQHALVKNSNDANAVPALSVENDVLALLLPTLPLAAPLPARTRSSSCIGACVERWHLREAFR
jgi:hypothetical protein